MQFSVTQVSARGPEIKNPDRGCPGAGWLLRRGARRRARSSRRAPARHAPPHASTVRSDEWPAWFSLWFSGCCRSLAKGTAWAGFYCSILLLLLYLAITQNGNKNYFKKRRLRRPKYPELPFKKKEFGGCPCGSAAADPWRGLRNGGGTGAAPVRNRCGTGADRVRNGSGTGAERVRNGCGTGAERRRICGAASFED